MKQSLMKKFALAALPLVLAGTLAGCMTQTEMVRYNALMDETVTRSLTASSAAEEAQSPQIYEQNLRLALKYVHPRVMEKIHKANAIVRLDSRLTKVKHGFFETSPYMGYYNDGKQVIITIPDKGYADLPYRLREHAYAADTVSQALEDLFMWHIDKDDLSKPAVKFGFRYFNSCDTQLCQNVIWSDAGDWSKGINNTPSLNLMQPPPGP